MDGWKDKLKMRLPAIVVWVVSLLFWGFYDRYEPSAAVLLESPSLADALRVRGDVSETNGVFTLTVPMSGKTADVRFALPGAVDHPYIRVSGRIRTEGVVRGKYSWNSARLLLIQRDDRQRWISGKHNLLAEDGSNDWNAQLLEFEINPKAALAEVVLQQTGKSGTAQFDQIRAQPVRIRSSFKWFRGIFCMLWVALGLMFFKRCRLDRRKLRVLILLNVIAILYGTLLPGKWISDATEKFKAKVAEQMVRKKPVPEAPVQTLENRTGPKPAKPKPTEAEAKRIGQFNDALSGIHKFGHFALFASLCFLVYWSAFLEGQHRSYFIKVAFDVLLFAAISESLQYLTMDRTPGLSDWMTDVYGMLFAFGLFLLVRFVGRIFPTSGRV